MEIDVSGRSISRLPRSEIRAFIDQSLRALQRARAFKASFSELSVVFVGDAEMRRFNQLYRNRNRTTDVLTFEGSADEADDQGQRPLGEIIISVDQARRQSREEGHSLGIEIRYLLLHGLLHALGYDHETDGGEMDTLEMKIRPRVGLS